MAGKSARAVRTPSGVLPGVQLPGVHLSGVQRSGGMRAAGLESAEVLAFARAAREQVRAGQTAELQAAAEWVVLHAVPHGVDDAVWAGRHHPHPEIPGDDGVMVLTGEGAPGIHETAVVDFGVAIGISTSSARARLAAAAELVYRLPQLWLRVQAGEVEPWRARRITDHTHAVPCDAAGWIDAQLAPLAHRCGVGAIERIVATAKAHFDTAAFTAELAAAEDGRTVRTRPGVTPAGTQHVDLTLDLTDAADFEAAVARMAEHLARTGCPHNLRVRRALAVGEIARSHLATPLSGVTPARRSVTLYLHHYPVPHPQGGAIHPQGWTWRVGNPRGSESDTTITTHALTRLLNHSAPGAKVVVKPVIDLNEDLASPGSAVPDVLTERVYLRDQHCVFPWCTRTARPPGEAQATDSDHVIPTSRGGPTRLTNLAALCRRHHRMKTFFGWTYTPLRPGRYLWSSRRGTRFLVHHGHTTPVRDHPPPTPP